MKSFNLSILVIIMLLTSLSSSQLYAVDVSMVPEKCLTNLCHKSIQWNNCTHNSTFVPVAGYKINIRNKPNINSKILTQLSIPNSVKIIYIIPKTVRIGKLVGKWTLIEYSDDITDNKRGWILDTFLGSKNKFSKYSKYIAKSIIMFNGDIKDTIIIHNDNSYTRTMQNYYPDAKIKTKIVKGHIFEYKNIIWFNDIQHQNCSIFLYLNKNGEIRKEYFEGKINK